MSSNTAKNLNLNVTAKDLHITKKRPDLDRLLKQGEENKEMRVSTANSKGRKLGWLGVEYSQRQNIAYFRTLTSEKIAVALYKAGKIDIWTREFDNADVFAWLDDEGGIPDNCPNMPASQVEAICRAEYEGADEEEEEAPKKPVARRKPKTEE